MVPLFVTCACDAKDGPRFYCADSDARIHVYQCIWEAANDGKILRCEIEVGNSDDPSAVAIKKGATTVGHVPRKISTSCGILLRRGGTILLGGGLLTRLRIHRKAQNSSKENFGE